MYIRTYICMFTYEHSDTSCIDHLGMREFMSGPPRYHLTIKEVSRAVRGFRDIRIFFFLTPQGFYHRERKCNFQCLFFGFSLRAELRGSYRYLFECL